LFYILHEGLRQRETSPSSASAYRKHFASVPATHLWSQCGGNSGISSVGRNTKQRVIPRLVPMEQINGTLDNIVLSCSLECRIKADIFPWSRSTWHFLQRSCLARACSKHAARQQFQLFSLNGTRASHLRMVIRLLFSLYRPTRIPFPVQYRHVEKANIIQDISETCSFRDCILTLRADPNTEQDFQSNISEGIENHRKSKCCTAGVNSSVAVRKLLLCFVLVRVRVRSSQACACADAC
jgi:hypothetical protein